MDHQPPRHLTTWLTAAVEDCRTKGEFRADTPITTLVRLQQQWLATQRFDMAEEFRH